MAEDEKWGRPPLSAIMKNIGSISKSIDDDMPHIFRKSETIDNLYDEAKDLLSNGESTGDVANDFCIFHFGRNHEESYRGVKALADRLTESAGKEIHITVNKGEFHGTHQYGVGYVGDRFYLAMPRKEMFGVLAEEPFEIDEKLSFKIIFDDCAALLMPKGYFREKSKWSAQKESESLKIDPSRLKSISIYSDDHFQCMDFTNSGYDIRLGGEIANLRAGKYTKGDGLITVGEFYRMKKQEAWEHNNQEPLIRLNMVSG